MAVPIFPQSQINQSFPVAGQGELPASPIDQTVDYQPYVSNTDYSLSNTSISSDGQKINEVMPGIALLPDSTSPDGATAAGFGALTNNALSTSGNTGLTTSISNYLGAQSFPTSGVSASTMKKITGDLFGGVGKKGLKDWAVKLTSRVTNETFVCDAMPTITEHGSVEYDNVDIVHHPGTILKYRTTPSREWSIGNIKLVSLTAADASRNQNFLNLLRTWRMPYYGYGTNKASSPKTALKLGAPPDVLMFSAYGKANIDRIPVVLVDLSWEWPNDVDYVHTTEGLPFPVLITISISIKEAWSPREFSGFDINAFRRGDMTNAYNAANVALPQYVAEDPNAGKSTGDAKKDAGNPPTQVPAKASIVPTATTSGSTSVSEGQLQSINSQEQALNGMMTNLNTPGVTQTQDQTFANLKANDPAAGGGNFWTGAGGRNSGAGATGSF